jgi:hypothetical protein
LKDATFKAFKTSKDGEKGWAVRYYDGMDPMGPLVTVGDSYGALGDAVKQIGASISTSLDKGEYKLPAYHDKDKEAKEITKKVKSLDKPIFTPSSESARKVRTKVGAYIHDYARNYGMTDSEMEEKVVDGLRAVTADKPISQRIHPGNLGIVMSDPERRLKTQFETGHSNGSYSPTYRAENEEIGIGVPKDVDPRMRPTYGYIPHPGTNPSQYGDIELVYKPHVRKRTTFTIGDSLGSFKSSIVLATPVDDPGIESADSDVSSLFRGEVNEDYIECQIHGGSTLDEVDHVVFHRDAFEYDTGELSTEFVRMEKRLKDMGFRVDYDKDTE